MFLKRLGGTYAVTITILAVSFAIGRTPSSSLVQAWQTPVASSFQRTPSRNFLGDRLASGTSKSRDTTALFMAVPVLEDWKLLRNGRVRGTVKNHPTIKDGDTITTSPITAPELAEPRRIVTTTSGSKYMLGQSEMVVSTGGKKVRLADVQKKAKKDFELTGDMVGDESQQYLLAGKPRKSTSGKSVIYKAYPSDDDGMPSGEPVLIKLSSNFEAIDRENDNYGRITKSGFSRGQFVQLVKYFPTASEMARKFRSQSALVLERGVIDLKRYVAENGKLEGKELRDAAAAAATCLQAVHTSGLVWTDMKTENFVVTEKGTVKGIDLESAMPVKDNPVDYSPEATPPEFAKAFLAGDGPYFVLEYNYDMWSYGMLLFELATGKGYFDGKSPVQITRALNADDIEIDISDADIDPKLRDLIKSCLQVNPKSRPSIVQVLLHPYFLTTGIGPFSF